MAGWMQLYTRRFQKKAYSSSQKTWDLTEGLTFQQHYDAKYTAKATVEMFHNLES